MARRASSLSVPERSLRRMGRGRLRAAITVAGLAAAVGFASAPPSEGLGTAPPAASAAGRETPSALGDRNIFPRRILVAYYGTATTASLGVLGEAPPDEITKRLRRAARPYARSGRKVQIVYELIVTIADGSAGSDGDYSHDIARSSVKKYIRAGRRNDALVVLDVQPGRSTFPSVARRWAWALKKPHVGLALDPEWRMGPTEVPAQTVGSVGAKEVNRTSRWLARLTRSHGLPEKVFIIHQFRTDMVEHIRRVKDRRPLAMIQHVDGFGSQAQKKATYHNVAKPRQFHMGFKLFYDEDSDMFRPREVLRLRPRVEYVSYQ